VSRRIDRWVDHVIDVDRIESDDWPLLRELRLRALADSMQWFAADRRTEAAYTEADWRARIDEGEWGAAVVDGTAVGLVGVAVVEPERGADCWIHGWWVDPGVRGTGIAHRMLDWLDQVALEQGWQRQGLGVWEDNIDAQGAFSSLGFQAGGPPQPSSRQPGKNYVAMYRAVG
jgi:RimJ/RimL family protein N-acetyltransferase